MSDVHLEVECNFDRTTPQRVTVIINRETKRVTMRAFNDRNVYETDFASMVQATVEKLCRLKALEGKRPRKLKVSRGMLRP